MFYFSRGFDQPLHNLAVGLLTATLLSLSACGGGSGGGSSTPPFEADQRALASSTGPFLAFQSTPENSSTGTLTRLVDMGTNQPRVLTLAEASNLRLAYTERTTTATSSTAFFPTDLLYHQSGQGYRHINMRNPGAPAQATLRFSDPEAGNLRHIVEDYATPASSLVKFDYPGRPDSHFFRLDSTQQEQATFIHGGTEFYIRGASGDIESVVISTADQLIQYDAEGNNPVIWLENQTSSLYTIRQTATGEFYILVKPIGNRQPALWRRAGSNNTNLGLTSSFSDFGTLKMLVDTTGVYVRDNDQIFTATHQQTQLRELAAFESNGNTTFAQTTTKLISKHGFGLHSIDKFTGQQQQLASNVQPLSYVINDKLYYQYFDADSLLTYLAVITDDGSQQTNLFLIDQNSETEFIGIVAAWSDNERQLTNRIYIHHQQRLYETRPASGMTITEVGRLPADKRAIQVGGRGRYLFVRGQDRESSRNIDLFLLDADAAGTNPVRLTDNDGYIDYIVD